MTIFNNKIFKFLLIGFIISLIAFNFYSFFQGQVKALIPIVVLFGLIFLIFTNHKYAKIGIKVWSIVFLAASGLMLLGQLIKYFVTGASVINFERVIKSLFLLIIGICIYHYNEKTVELKEEN